MRTHPYRPGKRIRIMKAALTITIALIAIAAAASHHAVAQVIEVEAEDYIDSLDTGGVGIAVVGNDACSGGYSVVGLDLPGEWVAYDLAVDTLGVYAPRFWMRGTYGLQYHFQLVLTPDTLGSPQTIDIFFIGSGYG
jgi:hypothetical protein